MDFDKKTKLKFKIVLWVFSLALLLFTSTSVLAARRTIQNNTLNLKFTPIEYDLINGEDFAYLVRNNCTAWNHITFDFTGSEIGQGVLSIADQAKYTCNVDVDNQGNIKLYYFDQSADTEHAYGVYVLSQDVIMANQDCTDMFRIDKTYQTSITFNNFNTRKTTNMKRMFCNSTFAKLDLSNWDVSNVEDMRSMFYSIDNTRYLTEINLTGWQTDSLKGMLSMFGYNEILKTIHGISNLNTSKVESMASAFSNCSSLTSLDLSGWDTSNVTYGYYDQGTGYGFDNMFGGCTSLIELNLSGWKNTKVTTMHNMFRNCSALTNLNLTNFGTSAVTDMRYMFADCTALETLDLQTFDTSNVAYMGEMFLSCTKLKTIHVSHLWNTSSVTNGDSMFYNTALVGGYGTTTNKGYGLSMAQVDWGNSVGGYGLLTLKGLLKDSLPVITGCTSLIFGKYSDYANTSDIRGRTADGSMSQYNTNEVQYYVVGSKMYVLFSGCERVYFNRAANTQRFFSDFNSNLKAIEFNGAFNTYYVTTMYEMFGDFASLTTLDLSGFDTRNVTSMCGMFSGCSELRSLNLSSFDTGKVTDMSYMFAGCRNLPEIDLSGFVTSKVINMSNMFYNCSSLKELDLSSFNTSKVKTMGHMFSSCRDLETIFASNLWSIASLAQVTTLPMFQFCYNLKGGAGTICYGAADDGYERAKIDGGTSNPGYFTRK